MAIAQLEKSPNQMLAMQYAPQLRQDAAGAQPPSFTGTLGDHQRAFVNGQQVAAGPDKPETVVVGNNLVEKDSGKIVATMPMSKLQESEIAKNNAEAKAAAGKANLLGDIPDGLTGDALMQTLKPVERASVQAIVNGDEPLPSRTANPQGQRIAGLVALADPTYNPSRLKVKQDVAFGTTSKNIKALGTAIGHADKLFDAFGGLNNMGGVGTLLNQPTNYINQTVLGKGPKTSVDATATALSNELESAFRGSGGSLTGIHEWRKSISSNLSPEQQATAKSTVLDLLDQRLDSVANQWNQVMPASQQRTGLDFLSPAQQKIYAKLKGAEAAAPIADGPPAGIDATTWAHMTPQEQALFTPKAPPT